MKNIALLTVVLGAILIAVGGSQGLTKDVNPHSGTNIEMALSSECPFGHVGGRGTWTGKTKVVNAKIFFEQKCIQGHKWFTAKASGD